MGGIDKTTIAKQIIDDLKYMYHDSYTIKNIKNISDSFIISYNILK